MAITRKEIKKKMLIRKTINAMNKQIQQLEEQKEKYIRMGKEAKQKGLTAQYNLALAGLKMTLAQQKRVYEMKLNFEITSQMKDVSLMTAEFLKGMGSLSKDMVKLTKERDFIKVEKSFNEAMENVAARTEQMEMFLDETQSTFDTATPMSGEDSKEIESLISSEAQIDESTEDMITKELEMLKKRMTE